MEPSDPPNNETSRAETSRAERLTRHRRGWHRRALVVALVVILGAGAGAAVYAVVLRPDASSAGTAAGPDSSSTPTTKATTTTQRPTTTTTTIPPVREPGDVSMPSPGSGLSYGSSGGTVRLYEARMKELHFDPGPVDGVFDQDTQYAVIAVQKYFNQPRTGVINQAVQLVLSHFRYSPAKPKSEPNRVEIDLDRQVITVFNNWQPILVTTTSTGSGEHFCGGSDGCQYAITPTGHYHFQWLHRGWDNGKLGRMWNPYYFNGGIAIHGLASVPAYPASHGCARIPMHVADYFYTLVQKDESVYVVGTPKQPGGGYVGPVHTAPAPPPAGPTPTTKPSTPTTKPSTPTTKPSPPTTKPSPPTTKKPSPPTT